MRWFAFRVLVRVGVRGAGRVGGVAASSAVHRLGAGSEAWYSPVTRVAQLPVTIRALVIILASPGVNIPDGAVQRVAWAWTVRPKR
ncbi:hypothetical protein TNCT6_72450 [Streptomyces sp. 6-11-2]|nr:hypothetical protein TNCT6_72450 [Streptomyces sp. 6-11-2]